MRREGVEAICDLLLDKGLALPWFCDARVDTVDMKLLRKMKAAGCYSISFGVESGSQRILDKVLGKGMTLERVRSVGSWVEACGIRPRWLFMVSLPSETMREASQTLDLAEELGGDNSIGVLKVYPGTPLEALAREKGILPKDFSWCSKEQSRAVSMSSIAGDAPVFLDRMGWGDIAEILMRYAEINRYPLRKRLLAALRGLRSADEAMGLLRMGIAYVIRRVRSNWSSF